jgi:hypothetical protein
MVILLPPDCRFYVHANRENVTPITSVGGKKPRRGGDPASAFRHFSCGGPGVADEVGEADPVKGVAEKG